MAINPFKAGRAVGKGVKYLTELGSKIGKGLGSSVDKLGAATRNTQASVLKGGRGVRDVASSAGSAVRQAGKDAAQGYKLGRRGGLHLSDVADKMPTKSSNVRKLPSLNEWMNTTGKGMIKNPMKMPGNMPSRPSKYPNAMRKGVSGGMSKPVKSHKDAWHDHLATKGKGYMTKESGGSPFSKSPFSKMDLSFDRSYIKKIPSGMSKNRRAGLITGGSIAAGYGVHKGNEALQNHYRQQKNAARGQ